MSETTCCYCGTGLSVFEAPHGWHVDCHDERYIPPRYRAEYAALALAHDAAMAEATRFAQDLAEQVEWLRLRGDQYKARAEAAEAQLAAAREDGARGLEKLLTDHEWHDSEWKTGCDCGFAYRYALAGSPWDQWVDHVIAAWRAGRSRRRRRGEYHRGI